MIMVMVRVMMNMVWVTNQGFMIFYVQLFNWDNLSNDDDFPPVPNQLWPWLTSHEATHLSEYHHLLIIILIIQL